MVDPLTSHIERERESSARLISGLAERLRRSLPGKGDTRDALRGARAKMHDAASYLPAGGNVGRPVAAVLVGIAAGFLIGRAIRR